MRKRKIGSAVLAALLVVIAITGCSGTKDKGTAAGQETGAGAGAAKDAVTLTALLDNNATFPYSKDWPIWKWIADETGVTLYVQTPSGKLSDTLNLVMASGNLPDLMYMSGRRDSNKYGDQGALENILDHVDQMPNLKKWMEQYPDEAKAALSADGKMYMFPNQGFGETNRMVWLYREDVFKKSGVEAPKTYEELHQVLKKLKQDHPDSYPLSMRFGQIPDEMYANLTTNFGTGTDVYYDFDEKKWKFGPTEDNYKKMVEMWHTFYQEGLIAPDFLSMQTKQWQDVMSTGQSFVTIDYISRVDFFNNAMQKDNPEYNLQFMAPPAGADAKQQNPYFHYLEGGLTVASSSKHIDEIMKYMDFFYSEKGRTMSSWGKEGETFTSENGQNKFKPEFTDVTEMRKETGLQTSGTYTWIDFNAHLSLFSDDLKKAYEEAAKYDPPAMQPKPAFTDAENEVLSVTGQAVKKYREENFSKFVLGTRNLKEWDKYVEEINGLGVQKLIDTYTAAQQRVEQAKLENK